jgi:hypothetical protein
VSYGGGTEAPTVEDMECVVCGRERNPSEPGWVVIASPPGEPRILYCDECLAEMVRAFGADEEDD